MKNPSRLRRAEWVLYRQPLAPRYGNQYCADLTVDNLTPASRIRMLSGEAGILPTDPLWPVVEALADIPGEVDLRIAPVLAQMQAATASVEKSASFTDQQVADIARRLAGSCQAWAGNLVKASVWRSWALPVGDGASRHRPWLRGRVVFARAAVRVGVWRPVGRKPALLDVYPPSNCNRKEFSDVRPAGSMGL